MQASQMMLSFISHEVEGLTIPQRVSDGYINATALCQASGKQFNDYHRLSATKAFLDALSADMGIPISDLIVVTKGGEITRTQGTWIHPDMAVNLGQWLSPKFAVLVSRWVREWMSGRVPGGNLPYHLRRYIANRGAIPLTHFSILNELIFGLIAPMEQNGYTLPESMLPDISEGKMFAKWLREEKDINTDAMPTYPHRYEDGRVVYPKMYPISLLEDFRKHFYGVWIPSRAAGYFAERDQKALPHIDRIVIEYQEQKRI